MQLKVVLVQYVWNRAIARETLEPDDVNLCIVAYPIADGFGILCNTFKTMETLRTALGCGESRQLDAIPSFHVLIDYFQGDRGLDQLQQRFLQAGFELHTQGNIPWSH